MLNDEQKVWLTLKGYPLELPPYEEMYDDMGFDTLEECNPRIKEFWYDYHNDRNLIHAHNPPSVIYEMWLILQLIKQQL